MPWFLRLLQVQQELTEISHHSTITRSESTLRSLSQAATTLNLVIPCHAAQTHKSQQKKNKQESCSTSIPLQYSTNNMSVWFRVYIAPASPFAGIRAIVRLNAGQHSFIVSSLVHLSVMPRQNPESLKAFWVLEERPWAECKPRLAWVLWLSIL
jgi:hypothetical protein